MSETRERVEYVVRCPDDAPGITASGVDFTEQEGRESLAYVEREFRHCSGPHRLIELTHHADGTTTERDITEVPAPPRAATEEGQ